MEVDGSGPLHLNQCGEPRFTPQEVVRPERERSAPPQAAGYRVNFFGGPKLDEEMVF